MEDILFQRFWIAIHYTYPVSIFLLLLVSRLLTFLGRNKNKYEFLNEGRNRYLLSIIWLLHIALVVLLVFKTALATICLRDAANRENHAVAQSTLAASIAVFLFFGAGFLPEADTPYMPDISNRHVWILALAFESAMLLFLTRVDDIASVMDSPNMVLIEIMSIAILSMMCIAHYLVRLSGPEFKDREHEPLIGKASCSKDGGTSANVSNDPQLKGWLDYFLGFSTLFPYLWPSGNRKHQIITSICFLILLLQRFINIMLPRQLGILVASLGQGRMPWSNIVIYIVLRGLQGAQGTLAAIRAILWIPVGQGLFKRLTCSAFRHILTLSLEFHLSSQMGEILAALSKGTALNTFLDGLLFNVVPMVVDLGIAAVYIFITFDAFFSLIVLSVLWTYIYMTINMAKYRGRKKREMAIRDREINATKTDAIILYETVHHNCAVDTETSKLERAVTSFQSSEYSVLSSLQSLNVVQNLLVTVGAALIVILSSYQISIGAQSVAAFVSLITYLNQLQAPLAFFGSFFNMVQNNLVDAERMLDLFKHVPTILDAPNAKDLPFCEGTVRFDNVSFFYNPRKPVLGGISFVVRPGETTAIVGESGSGKSTCLRLLFRFYDVIGGGIYVDGHDIRDLKQQALRERIGVVPQDTCLFNASIYYNVLYARPDASLEEVEDACRAANVHDRILSFPDGYDTMVGERGLRLSGGEKQRVVLARAILKQPQIMLLDEATASLDSATERQIQYALQAATKDRTTITIAHRLSTIVNADQILVLHAGQIVERGTHIQLLGLGGRYKEMWDKQTEQQRAEEDAASDQSK